jgi:hypothetical protein
LQHKIPTPLRAAILAQIVDAGLQVNGLAIEFLKQEGFGTVQDMVDQVRRDHGDAAADAMAEDMRELGERETSAALGSNPFSPYRQALIAEHLARWSFLSAPDSVFAAALTCGFAQLWLTREQAGAPWGTTSQVISNVNELFVKRAVPYRVDAEGEVHWHGDQKTYQAITEPALTVLADSRLAGARTEYEDALAGLRSGNEKALEDAIEESAKAVESTMKVLIDESKLTRSGKETADPLIRILAQGNVIPAHVDQMLFAAARIRNAAGGHGTGSVPRHTPEDLAVACVAAAGVAITYLGGKLP